MGVYASESFYYNKKNGGFIGGDYEDLYVFINLCVSKGKTIDELYHIYNVELACDLKYLKRLQNLVYDSEKLKQHFIPVYDNAFDKKPYKILCANDDFLRDGLRNTIDILVAIKKAEQNSKETIKKQKAKRK